MFQVLLVVLGLVLSMDAKEVLEREGGLALDVMQIEGCWERLTKNAAMECFRCVGFENSVYFLTPEHGGWIVTGKCLPSRYIRKLDDDDDILYYPIYYWLVNATSCFYSFQLRDANLKDFLYLNPTEEERVISYRELEQVTPSMGNMIPFLPALWKPEVIMAMSIQSQMDECENCLELLDQLEYAPKDKEEKWISEEDWS